MADWQGAQWVLATIMAGATICPPVLRWALLHRDPTRPATTWTEYWRTWTADLITRAALVAILIWGGFF